MGDLLMAYEDFLREDKRACANTVSSYLRDVKRFVSAMEEQGIAVHEVIPEDVERYIHTLLQQGRAPSTVSRMLASIKSLYHYLMELGAVQTDPARKVTAAVKVERKPPQILTGSEVAALLAQPDTKDPKGLRDRAMLEVLCASGLRVTELIDLDVDDLDLATGALSCQSRGRQRKITLPPSAVKAVEEYLQKGRAHILKDHPGNVLFVNMGGERMSRQGFWKLIKLYRQKAGIQKEITPHTLRHSVAVRMVESGADLREVQEFMGHADIASTQIYSKMLSRGELTAQAKDQD